MKELKTKIRELIMGNIIIDFDKKKFITKNLNSFTNKSLQEILDLLENAQKIQNKALIKALQKNPERLKEIHEFARSLFKKDREDKETLATESDKEALINLDKELENLII